jgi:uncharacterized protein YjiS (DUF1127 family)
LKQLKQKIAASDIELKSGLATHASQRPWKDDRSWGDRSRLSGERVADEEAEMPANDQRHGWMRALAPLLRVIAKWRQRRAARRGARLHGFMQMSDRMLADIGVRRADVHAAMSGMMPVEHMARTQGGRPWTAQIHPLCRASSKALAANDLSAAA